MKTRIVLKRMEIENFKGCKKREIDFFNKTEIKGRNEAGKTTINDAFTWVLFGKDSHGSTKFDVRPQDSNGNQIDFVDIVVRLFLEINGKPVEIEKTQKQKWVKKRGNTEQTFEGNENLYVVNTIPKAEKDFKKYIGDIVSEDIFKFVSNTNAFMSLPSKDRRKTLFELVADIDDQTILDSDKVLKDGLSEELSKYTYDEILSRDKKSLLESKKKLIEIPSRIDEVSRKIVEVDYTDTEIKLAGLKKELADVEEPGADSLAKYQEISDIKGKILEQKSKLREVESEKTLSAGREKRELTDKYTSESSLLNSNKRMLESKSERVKDLQKDIERKKTRKSELVEKYKGLKALEFSDSTICPTCKQEFPQEKKDELIARFDEDKRSKLLEVESDGKAINNSIKTLADALKSAENEVKEHLDKVDKQQTLVDELKAKLDAIPDEKFNIMECQDCLDILAVIEDLQKQLSLAEESVKDVEKLKEETAEKKQAIKNQIDECQAVLNGKKVIEDAKIRVEELEQEQREVSQTIASTEQEIYLLEEFNRAKVNMLSEKINSHFDLVNWKLFAKQINGGYSEVCEPMVKGKSYATALNSGHKILAELDIIKALQKIYDCEVPVFLDNAERVNSFNLPNMECQLIALRVAENEELEIMEV